MSSPNASVSAEEKLARELGVTIHINKNGELFAASNDAMALTRAMRKCAELAEQVRPDDNPFRICYLRCDPDYEVVPHIHAPEGFITVGDEIDRMNFDGCKVVVVSDVRSVMEINGKLEILFQACFECKTRWIGSQNYAHCPNCGKIMVHVTEGKNDRKRD